MSINEAGPEWRMVIEKFFERGGMGIGPLVYPPAWNWEVLRKIIDVIRREVRGANPRSSRRGPYPISGKACEEKYPKLDEIAERAPPKKQGAEPVAIPRPENIRSARCRPGR